LSETRWKSRIDSIVPIRYQLSEVYDALFEVSEKANDPLARREAATLANALNDFKFIFSLVVWHDILNRINIISKLMQDPQLELSDVVRLMEETQVLLRH